MLDELWYGLPIVHEILLPERLCPWDFVVSDNLSLKYSCPWDDFVPRILMPSDVKQTSLDVSICLHGFGNAGGGSFGGVEFGARGGVWVVIGMFLLVGSMLMHRTVDMLSFSWLCGQARFLCCLPVKWYSCSLRDLLHPQPFSGLLGDLKVVHVIHVSHV